MWICYSLSTCHVWWCRVWCCSTGWDQQCMPSAPYTVILLSTRAELAVHAALSTILIKKFLFVTSGYIQSHERESHEGTTQLRWFSGHGNVLYCSVTYLNNLALLILQSNDVTWTGSLSEVKTCVMGWTCKSWPTLRILYQSSQDMASHKEHWLPCLSCWAFKST